MEIREKNGGSNSWRKKYNNSNNYHNFSNNENSVNKSYSGNANRIVAAVTAAKLAAPAKPLKIIFEQDLNNEDLSALRDILMAHPGNSETYFKIKQRDKNTIVKTGFRVNNSVELAAKIAQHFSDSLKIVQS